MEPLDLTNKPPRSCYEELDGLMLMPRTIDKLRAFLPGGNPGEYFINGKITGISGYLLQRLGIEEDALLDAIHRARDENEVAQWLREHSDAREYPEINETLRRIRRKHVQDPAYFTGLYEQTLAMHPGLDRIIDIVDADDKRLFPDSKRG
jgi:hypothetical protein